MEWNEIVQQIFDAKVPLVVGVCGVIYTIGLFTWGITGTREATEGFGSAWGDQWLKFWQVVGATIIWILSPIWVPIGMLISKIVMPIVNRLVEVAREFYELY